MNDEDHPMRWCSDCGRWIEEPCEHEIDDDKLDDASATAIVREKFGNKWFAVTRRDMNGRPFKFEVGYVRKGKNFGGHRNTLTTIKGESLVSLEEAISKAIDAMLQLEIRREARARFGACRS